MLIMKLVYRSCSLFAFLVAHNSVSFLEEYDFPKVGERLVVPSGKLVNFTGMLYAE
jgi:hypothetical protein